MTTSITRGKTAAERGYTLPDPREYLAELREHLGLAEGHLAALHRLLRNIEETLDQPESPGRVEQHTHHDRAA